VCFVFYGANFTRGEVIVASTQKKEKKERKDSKRAVAVWCVRACTLTLTVQVGISYLFIQVKLYF